jgi:hypothetical protein
MGRETRGYRKQRLAQRRNARSRTWQTVTLYVLAAIIAFGAVIGAIAIARRVTKKHVMPSASSYVALVTIGVGETGREPVAGILVYDRPQASYSFYVIPRELLFTGASDQYIVGEDAMVDPAFRSYVERLIEVPVDYTIALSYDDLAKVAGGEDVWVELGEAIKVTTPAGERSYEAEFALPSSDIAEAMSATGAKGPEAALLEQKIIEAVLKAAALRPEKERDAMAEELAPRVAGVETRDGVDILDDLIGGRVSVARIPSKGVVFQGTFNYRPDREQITALITRKAPEFKAHYNVIVQNGSGEAGVGQAVGEQLAVLDVNLPPVRNADSFDYRQTQILAGSDALEVARDVRAILGRGVILGGTNIPADTVIVIVGHDLKTKDLK